MKGPLKRGAVAKLLDCNIETIRYYESIDLVAASARSDAGHRLFSQADVERLRFALRLRQLGFALAEVRELLTMTEKQTFSCKQVAGIAEMHLSQIHRKVADLRQLAASLEEITSQCQRTDTPDCALVLSLKAPNKPLN
ncbi:MULTISPECIES: helix-turn-helix domain-containing protein [Maricaulis]|jgi:MerR family mercuric resistance operon transcriptional regulator|uniref:Transcriptional regulator, MerR family n=1 Tax=Maricaulis maris (strain MCS10) TaxID=394221 RepID=Q0AQP9_MARMM|nr:MULTISPECIES: helix-turn-helix domain-containing protein [Maricaulis]ABI65388.1 transcriptional regulator, MerR family [Maricaulis maris MCS10]MAC90251.1 transcriptional regulator [Maricaulis sp.]